MSTKPRSALRYSGRGSKRSTAPRFSASASGSCLTRPSAMMSGIARSTSEVAAEGAAAPPPSFSLNPFQRAALWLAVIITPALASR